MINTPGKAFVNCGQTCFGRTVAMTITIPQLITISQHTDTHDNIFQNLGLSSSGF